MKKEYNELLDNFTEGSIKAVRIYNTGDEDSVDVLTSDGNLYERLPYGENTAPVLIALITESTLVYDTRTNESFNSLVKYTKDSNNNMLKQFEELCKQNDIDFESIKPVLVNKSSETPVVQQIGRGIPSEEPKTVSLEFSGTPEQVMHQMENAIKEHPELKQILTSPHGMLRPLMFPFFPF